MDNLTHTLVGFTLGATPLRRAGRGATAALVIASSLPDVEVLAVLTNGRLAYLESHRGATHGPIGVVAVALTAAAVVRLWPWRRDARLAAPRYLPLAGLALAAVLCHVMLDFATSYGTRVLSPFTEAWFGVDWMPIVEPYLLALLAAGLAAGRLRPASRGRIAAATLALAVSLLAGRGVLHEIAVGRAVAHQAPASTGAGGPSADRRPSPLFHYLWPTLPPELPAALPSAWSPFRWRIVRAVPGGYELSELDLLLGATRASPVFHPRTAGRWVELASRAPTPRVFVAFMRFPAVFVSRRPNGDVMVRWNDIRFAPPGRSSAPDGSNPASHFGAWARLAPDGRLVAHGLGSG